MARKVFLPLTQRFLDVVSTPTAIAMRERLGGRVPGGVTLSTVDGSLALGALVAIDDSGGARRVGVLLAVTEGAADVYVDAGLVKRVKGEQVRVHRGAVPATLEGVAEHVMVFASLSEGQLVEVERPGVGPTLARLVEKCRYGALVELEDRSLLGVGFRKIWPVPVRGGSS